MNILKEVFTELIERFENTENIQALETLANYFEDFNFELTKIEKNDIRRKFKKAFKDLNI